MKALRTNSMLSDDEPLYDSVASDEDYASIGDNHSAKGIKMDDKQPDVGHVLSRLALDGFLYGRFPLPGDCIFPTFSNFFAQS